MTLTKLLKKAIKAYDRNGYGCGEDIDLIREIPERLAAIKEAVKQVTDAWESGDLAGAINELVAETEDL